MEIKETKNKEIINMKENNKFYLKIIEWIEAKPYE